jgi:hypothetical protein
MKRGTYLPKGKNLWLTGFVFLFIISNSSITFALDPLGPPKTNLVPGQFQLGLEYSRSNMDFQLIDGEWTETIYGSFNDSGTTIDLVLKDFEQNSSYIYLGYGIDYNWEIFVRLSSTKAEFGDSLLKLNEKFESDSKPAFGGGIKATLFENYNFKIGGIVQANMSSHSGQLYSPLWEVPHFVESDITEIQIALGASYMWIDGICIYGGPIMHLISGEYTDTYIEEAEIGGLLLSEYTWDIEQDSMYGGYLGTEVEIGKNCYFNVEYQFTGAADAFTAGILFGF